METNWATEVDRRFELSARGCERQLESMDTPGSRRPDQPAWLLRLEAPMSARAVAVPSCLEGTTPATRWLRLAAAWTAPRNPAASVTLSAGEAVAKTILAPTQCIHSLAESR